MAKENLEQIITQIKTLENMEPEDLIKLASFLAQREAKENKLYGESELAQLQSAYQEFLKPANFQIGQLVKWKQGLKNRKIPQENQPAIVVEILDSPIYEQAESGTPYFREPLDIALAIIDNNDGDFLIFHYDKRRFQLYS